MELSPGGTMCRPTEMPEPSGGWLAADGRHWPCRDLENATTAIEIVRVLRLAPEATPWRTWKMHVFDNGGVMGCSSLTQAQMDTLMDLASAHPAMRRWVMISLDVETSEDDVDVVLRRHGVKLQA